jgi:hypothetical protein
MVSFFSLSIGKNLQKSDTARFFKLDIISKDYNQSCLPEPLCEISTLWAKTLAAGASIFADRYCLIFRIMTESELETRQPRTITIWRIVYRPRARTRPRNNWLKIHYQTPIENEDEYDDEDEADKISRFNMGNEH